jgi:hypothetical protein
LVLSSTGTVAPWKSLLAVIGLIVFVFGGTGSKKHD